MLEDISFEAISYGYVESMNGLERRRAWLPYRQGRQLFQVPKPDCLNSSSNRIEVHYPFQ